MNRKTIKVLKCSLVGSQIPIVGLDNFKSIYTESISVKLIKQRTEGSTSNQKAYRFLQASDERFECLEQVQDII